MSEFTTSKGIWRGWYWRFISLAILVVIVLQVIAFYALHYPLFESLPIVVLVMSYIVAPRVKERRLANTLVAVAVTFVISFILQIALEFHMSAFTSKNLPGFLQTNAFALIMGLVMAFAYLKLTEWSERTRTKMEAKRASQTAPSTPSPVRRHRTVKRKKKR